MSVKKIVCLSVLPAIAGTMVFAGGGQQKKTNWEN
jgi:hypothetical protein